MIARVLFPLIVPFISLMVFAVTAAAQDATPSPEPPPGPPPDPGTGSLHDRVAGLWPADTDLSYQYIVYLFGKGVTTLTGIGDAPGATLPTLAITSLGSLFLALAGCYIVWRTVKGIFHGAHRSEWIGDARSSVAVIGPVVGFLSLIPITAIQGFTAAHSVPIYTAVTGIGIANMVTRRVLDAYGELPLVSLSMRKFIDPVAYQAAVTMLNAQVCMRVMNETEGVQLHRSVETTSQANADQTGPPGVLPGLPPSANARVYDPLVQEAAARYGVPPALIHAIIQAESGYNPRATSSKGAMGLMQLMPGTARRFGVSNAYDPRENIMGGTAYLAWLLKRFDGDLSKAIAGYNAGEGAVERHGGVPPYPETQKYLAKVTNFYNRNIANGIPGGVAGTLHTRKVMWGGAPYDKNFCGELEYPIAYTMTKPEPVGQLHNLVLTDRDVLMERLEERMAGIAQALIDRPDDQDALATALLSAIMDFDFALHHSAMTGFEQYGQAAMDEFIQGVKVEGWSTLGAYFMKLAALQEAIGSATQGIEARGVVEPGVHATQHTEIMLKGHLLQVGALLHRANPGMTEAQRIELARDIARQNGLTALRGEFEQYVSMQLDFRPFQAQSPYDVNMAQLSHPRSDEYYRTWKEAPAEKRAIHNLLNTLASGSDRFPLLKYQELGKMMIAGSIGISVVSEILTFWDVKKFGESFAGFLAAVFIVLGYILAIFLPLLPLLVWTLAVLNWFINLAVIMVAAPVWGLFAVNLPRAKVGVFMLLRLLLYPAFLVMGLVLVAGLLMVADAIIDKTLITELLRLGRADEYTMAFGVLILYILTVITVCVAVTRLMVLLIEWFYSMADVSVGPAVAIPDERLISGFKRPVSQGLR